MTVHTDRRTTDGVSVPSMMDVYTSVKLKGNESFLNAVKILVKNSLCLVLLKGCFASQTTGKPHCKFVPMPLYYAGKNSSLL